MNYLVKQLFTILPEDVNVRVFRPDKSGCPLFIGHRIDLPQEYEYEEVDHLWPSTVYKSVFIDIILKENKRV